MRRWPSCRRRIRVTTSPKTRSPPTRVTSRGARTRISPACMPAGFAGLEGAPRSYHSQCSICPGAPSRRRRGGRTRAPEPLAPALDERRVPVLDAVDGTRIGGGQRKQGLERLALPCVEERQQEIEYGVLAGRFPERDHPLRRASSLWRGLQRRRVEDDRVGHSRTRPLGNLSRLRHRRSLATARRRQGQRPSERRSHGADPVTWRAHGGRRRAHPEERGGYPREPRSADPHRTTS